MQVFLTACYAVYSKQVQTHSNDVQTMMMIDEKDDDEMKDAEGLRR